MGPVRQVELLDQALAPADHLAAAAAALEVLRGQVLVPAQTEHSPHLLVDTSSRQLMAFRPSLAPGQSGRRPTAASASRAVGAPRSRLLIRRPVGPCWRLRRVVPHLQVVTRLRAAAVGVLDEERLCHPPVILH